ncbi:hypothetical protein [Polluticaenibacter yanchengensis]|uniref:hypothetical protein n=1 Tax=Polluticaenibacter yanchengensis TaxID=3014562 RepID=UPI00387B8663
MWQIGFSESYYSKAKSTHTLVPFPEGQGWVVFKKFFDFLGLSSSDTLLSFGSAYLGVRSAPCFVALAPAAKAAAHACRSHSAVEFLFGFVNLVD